VRRLVPEVRAKVGGANESAVLPAIVWVEPIRLVDHTLALNSSGRGAGNEPASGQKKNHRFRVTPRG